jgi:hypothetical protein
MDAKEKARIASREWRKNNPEKYREQQRRAREQNGHRYHLKKCYGLTEFQYDAMVIEQAGGCATCGEPYSIEKKLHVDHDHATGKVRGLLCTGCNKALGCVKDNPDVLIKLAGYIERSTSDGR